MSDYWARSTTGTLHAVTYLDHRYGLAGTACGYGDGELDMTRHIERLTADEVDIDDVCRRCRTYDDEHGGVELGEPEPEPDDEGDE